MKNFRVTFYEAPDVGVEFVSVRRMSGSYPEHVHVSTFVFSFVLRGEAVVVRGSRRRSYAAGDFFVLHPYEPHALIVRDPCDLFSVCVEKNAVDRKLPTDVLEEYILFFERQGTLDDGEGLLILDTLRKWTPREPAGKKIRPPAEIEAARKRLERHPDRRLPLEEMARKACLGKYHFLRTFRENAGLTPHRFQLLNRIRRSKPELRGRQSAAEAALNAGFCDQSHFCRTFRKYVGLTPNEYRESWIELKLRGAGLIRPLRNPHWPP